HAAHVRLLRRERRRVSLAQSISAERRAPPALPPTGHSRRQNVALHALAALGLSRRAERLQRSERRRRQHELQSDAADVSDRAPVLAEPRHTGGVLTMRARSLLLCAALGLAPVIGGVVSACGPSDFDPATKVQSVRILASRVRDNKSYAKPGDKVTLE